MTSSDSDPLNLDRAGRRKRFSLIKMAIYLLCLTDGGMPIFTRKKGECGNLPFSTVASLNGFHMFFKSLDIALQTTYADNGWTYVWRDFKNVITLIACGDCGEAKLTALTEIVYAAFSLFISLDEILHPALMERMKKESKNFMPLIDAALEDTSLLGYTDCILTYENSALLQKLNEFSSQCNSLFCAIVVSQKVVVASDGFWDLDLIDRQLLLLLLNTSSSLQNDIPIYLPKKSPNVAYRFVSIPIAPNSALSVICGSNPTQSYTNLHSLAQNLFRSETATLLQNVERCSTRCLPEQFEVNSNVLSLILINRKSKKCVFSRNAQPLTNSKRGGPAAAASASSSNISIAVNNATTHLDMLRRFFDQSFDISKFIEQHDADTETNIIDQYWCSDSHKCYALSEDGTNAIFVLFNAFVPTHTMRLTTQHLLNSILQEKSICW